MVMRPLAPPNISAKAAATGTEMPSSANMTKAQSSTAQREARHPQRMQVAAEGEFDQPRAPTCAGPNSAPIHTTVPASIPERAKIASRCADRPDGTKA